MIKQENIEITNKLRAQLSDAEKAKDKLIKTFPSERSPAIQKEIVRLSDLIKSLKDRLAAFL